MFGYILQSCCSTTSRSDLSKSTTSLASKTTWYGTLDSADLNVFFSDSDSQSDSDNEDAKSVDSFYERSFEAMEQLLDSEWCYRDSAVFSDRDDSNLAIAASEPVAATESVKRKNAVVTSAKSEHVVQQCDLNRNRSMAILERLRSFEEKDGYLSKEPILSSTSLENLKTIDQRRHELNQAISVTTVTRHDDESETSSQHSTSTINTVVEIHLAGHRSEDSDSSPIQRRSQRKADLSSSPPHSSYTKCEVPNSTNFLSNPQLTTSQLPKGWVKLIIGKLQGDVN